MYKALLQRLAQGIQWIRYLSRYPRSIEFEVTRGAMLMPEKTENPSVTLPGKVEKIIKPLDRYDTEKAQINIEEGADPLYKEIRIENTLTNAEGEVVSLKKGAKVHVTVDADPSGTIAKREI